uniref:Uncharacterized protein n=1 Tax=viral metagenome TaxID=1070528 RepID=A0A6C0BPD4_9ZZZZ
MSDVQFHWNRRFSFDPDQKYLVYFRGCFCPCHKNHLAQIEPYYDVPNVNIFISQMGSEHRHGVPARVNRKIWKSYIKHCVPAECRQRIRLEQMQDGAADIKPHLDGIHRVLYVMGNEKEHLMEHGNPGPDQIRRLKKARRKREHHLRQQRERLVRILAKRHIGLDFVIDDRVMKGKVSATQFVAAIRRGATVEELSTFMPDALPLKQRQKIISRLRKCRLH